MGLPPNAAFKVAVSENLLWGLFLLPLWFKHQRLLGFLRVASWAIRLGYAFTLTIIFTQGFRNDKHQPKAMCVCKEGRNFTNMQYSVPLSVQPRCKEVNNTFLFSICDNSTGPQLALSTEVASGSESASGFSSPLLPPPSLPPAPATPKYIQTSDTTCWSSSKLCCTGYLNSRIFVGAKDVMAEDRGPFEIYGVRDWVECETEEPDWRVEAGITCISRWILLEPVVGIILLGKYGCKKVPFGIRFLLPLPILMYLIWFAIQLLDRGRTEREILGVPHTDMGLESSIISNLLTSLLGLDLLKETAWQMMRGKQEDLDEDGLPIIDGSQTSKVYSE